MIKASHNAFLEKQWLMLWAFVDLLRGERWSHSDRPETGHVEHEQLFEAIARRDAVLARSLSEQHVDRAWKNIATLLTWNNSERSDEGGMTTDNMSELTR
jgi:DNA-binding GntR family transcriptional regulator